MDVISLHKQDLATGRKSLKAQAPQSNVWWEIKERLKKYEIAFSQSLNLAVQAGGNIFGLNDDLAKKHLAFYKILTNPYRPEKKLKEGMTNLDSEITIEPTHD